METKSGRSSLLIMVVLTIGLLVATFAAGNRPLLGLDLQGGAEIVLRPSDDPDNLELASNPINLERSAEIIRKRVDAIGVAEPDVTVQGTDLVVQLPGEEIDDQQRAIELVGQTAELRFRPVLIGPIPLGLMGEAAASYEAQFGNVGDAISGTDQAPAAAPDDSGDATGDASTGDAAGDGEDESGFGLLVPGQESAAAFQDDNPAPAGSPLFGNLRFVEGINGGPGSDEFFAGFLTDPKRDIEEQSVVLISDPAAGSPNAYLLGPTLFTGAALEGASANNVGIGQWIVSILFQEGEDGVGKLNSTADLCFFASVQCPEGSVAVVLDSTVQSTNGFESPTFDQREVQLSRDGGFSEEEAVDSALILDFGALPLAFDDPAEAGLIRSVSATLGRDSLNAGLIAGAVGLALVALYMIWYYRLLGLAAILSLGVSASLLWVIVAYLSESQGLALTLAGVVGLIVAIGVSLDSNVVYFEHIKEDISAGRPLKAAADASFPAAFRTVFWANMATLIGAAILYFLTVGSVKGFALMLAIASILDLIATYFFMRPLVEMLVGRLHERPRMFGIRGREAQA